MRSEAREMADTRKSTSSLASGGGEVGGCASRTAIRRSAKWRLPAASAATQAPTMPPPITRM